MSTRRDTLVGIAPTNSSPEIIGHLCALLAARIVRPVGCETDGDFREDDTPRKMAKYVAWHGHANLWEPRLGFHYATCRDHTDGVYNVTGLPV
jgi:hypothetical protein